MDPRLKGSKVEDRVTRFASPTPRLSSVPGAIGLVVLLWIIHVTWSFWIVNPLPIEPNPYDFRYLADHCADIPPISSAEFTGRQLSLVRMLHSLNASAYVAEPGASAEFYANISNAQWHLSERPLLLVISPSVESTGGADGDYGVQAKLSILTPTFEATRAKLLHVPSTYAIEYAEWPEDADPYEVAIANILPSLKSGNGTIYVDGSTRNFIVDGLKAAAPQSTVLSAPVEVRQLRERKSKAELDILKCVNEVTILAVRAVREKLYIGMRESEAQSLIRTALSSAGLTSLDSIVLFGENAALPHGSGSDRVLKKSDFVLIDCGGSLHGYSSDVTRTFALDDSKILEDQLSIWKLVQSAQSAALSSVHDGAITRTIDEAARTVISDAGYGRYFTHRLGHGIGLEVHESPYLRGGSDDVIGTGHTFSDEPGIYIEGKVGVRLEDCFYVTENGDALFLTEGAGGQARSPWDI
ncbi:peptidase M24 [Neolentinus lepideus HHB14362 ss-1]|uniref:Peptidase M24 n=1 Tax=Neolentinus lepideus HHB14362 ss-1 TaxID=1314782 RepID=A0A165UPJ0_9AGAM|nr:peptidase M24 [Neolentinus lepideus HHB14362 ss-1]